MVAGSLASACLAFILLGTVLGDSGVPTSSHARSRQLRDPSQWWQSSLQSVNGSRQDSPEACVYAGLSEVVNSCPAHNSTSSGSSSPRDALIRIIQRCILRDRNATNTTKAPMRLIVSASNYVNLIKPLVSTYANTMDITIPSMRNAANLTKTHEAWSMYSVYTGVGIQKFKNITNLVALDQRLNWENLLPIVRKMALQYKQEVMSLPISVFPYMLYYRKDVFTRRGIPVPRTWRELLNVTRRYNGTEGMHAFCGLWSDCTRAGLLVIRGLLSSMLQTQGPTQGWLFDTDSMELNLNTTAMAETLTILKGLYIMSPPDNSPALGCPWYSPRFAAGQCLMTIHLPSSFKYLGHKSRAQALSKVQGNIGVATWPGSEVVYDRATKSLVPCTEDRCPYATRYFRPDGSSYLVNHSPCMEAIIWTVNVDSDPDMSFFTYSVLAYLTSDQVSPITLFDKDSELSALRPQHLDPNLWEFYGWNYQDAKEYCDNSLTAFSHPNWNLQMRLPGALDIIIILSALMPALYAGLPIPMLMGQIQSAASDRMRAIYGNSTDAMRAEYFGSMNRVPPSPSPPPAPPALSPPSQLISVPSQQNTDEGLSPGIVAACVVAPFAAVAMGLVGWIAYQRRRHGLKLRHHGHPGAGPTTTLCVTDIENSTLLWEEVEALVMDTSVKLHNGCIRNLAAKYGGYESVWEGDSFVIAFPHPVEALSFCMAAQTELMKLPWPAELLANAHGQVVWCQRLASLPVIDYTTSGSATPTAIRSVTDGRAQPPSSGSAEGRAQASTSSAREGVASAAAQRSSDTPSVVSLVLEAENSVATASLVALVAAAASSDVGNEWKNQWVVCQQSPSATLAYKGLRVRLGIHSGVDSEACIAFNPTMQRYQYTGPVRVISNAIASAGHGGHTLMSTSTAALLDRDGTGLLAGLPYGCGVYHQGKHLLAGTDDPHDLLLVLPHSLSCRLALLQAPLRSMSVTAPGVLSAPVPSKAASDTTALVFVQIAGISTLMAWDAQETLSALRAMSACVHQILSDCGGILSKDGLELVLRTGSVKDVKASFPDHCTAGQVVAAFGPAQGPEASDSQAVKFAVLLRKRLLSITWSHAILAHELCEPIGQLPRDASGVLASFVVPVNSRRRHSVAVTQAASAYQPHGQSLDAAQRAARPSSSGWALAGSGASPFEAGFDQVGSSGLRIRVTDPGSEVLQASAPDRSNRSSLLGGAMRRASVLGFGGGDAASFTMQHGVSLEQARAGGFTVLDSPALRGMRVRMAAVRASAATLAIATRSSGRAVYAGPPVKKAIKLLVKAKAGQIVVDRSFLSSASTAGAGP